MLTIPFRDSLLILLPLQAVILYIGIIVGAASGALAALSKKMDPVGIIILAIVASSGGGTLRDIMIDETPVFILNKPWYVFTAVLTAFLVMFFARFWIRYNRLLDILDAFALGVFAVFGLEKGLEKGIHPAGCIALAAITASGGGIIRDVLCREIPKVFHREIYILPTIIGSSIYLGMVSWLSLPVELAAYTAKFMIISLRLLAIQRRIRLRLPAFLRTPEIYNE